jgi:glutamine synthetase
MNLVLSIFFFNSYLYRKSCWKGIPTDHWERTCEKGFQLVYGATANLFTDRHGNYIGYGPEAKELVGIPDPETFCQLTLG